MRPWILPAVYERLRTGRGEFLAELRPAIPVFVRFGGIDYDEDDDAAAKLDDFVRRASASAPDYGGNVAPAHARRQGRVPLRRLRLAARPRGRRRHALRPPRSSCARSSSVTDRDRILTIGIADGRLRSGTYGHAMRRTFVCLGDAVNLAARLMSAAPPGQVYVAEAAQELAGEALHAGNSSPT